MTYEQWLLDVELFLFEIGYSGREVGRFMDYNSNVLFDCYQAGYTPDFTVVSLM